MGCNYFLPLWLGWLAFAAICLLVIAGIPWRTGQESRQGHYPKWHPPDVGWALWCSNNVQCPEYEALFPQAMIRWGKNVAEFRVCLSQQVQILQLEYPGRIQQEHIEEMKQDCFYEGLNPEYQWMLAHKVDSEHPARYSNLLLADQKLERWI